MLGDSAATPALLSVFYLCSFTQIHTFLFCSHRTELSEFLSAIALQGASYPLSSVT